MAVFLFIAGYFFYSIFSYYARVSMQSAMNPMGGGLNVTDGVLRPLLSNFSVILLLMMPLITMRLFAWERRSRTIKPPLPYPFRHSPALLPTFPTLLAPYG